MKLSWKLIAVAGTMLAGCGGAEVNAAQEDALGADLAAQLCGCDPAKAVWRFNSNTVSMRIDEMGNGVVTASSDPCLAVGDIHIKYANYIGQSSDGHRLYSYEQQPSTRCGDTSSPYMGNFVVQGSGAGSKLWGGTTTASGQFSWNWVSW
jgi:hypothetical protein